MQHVLIFQYSQKFSQQFYAQFANNTTTKTSQKLANNVVVFSTNSFGAYLFFMTNISCDRLLLLSTLNNMLKNQGYAQM